MRRRKPAKTAPTLRQMLRFNALAQRWFADADWLGTPTRWPYGLLP